MASKTYALDREFVPADRLSMVSMTNSFYQENINARAAEFTAVYSGFWLSSNFKVEQVAGEPTISPDEEYFASLDPLIRILDMADNDYNAIALQAGDTFGLSTNVASLATMLTKLTNTYTVTWGETLEETKTVSDFAAGVVAKVCTPGMSDKDKIKTLHDYIVNNFEYDQSGLIHLPYNFIIQKKGVCSAYAGLMWQMLTKAGIESRIIRKDAKAGEGADKNKWIDHSWNLVMLDGNWYHVDVTWDDPITSNGTQVLQYDFFLKSDSFMAATHVWDTAAYEAAPENYAGQVSIRTVSVSPSASQSTVQPIVQPTNNAFDINRIFGFLPGSTLALLNKYYIWIIGLIVLFIIFGIIGRIFRRKK